MAHQTEPVVLHDVRHPGGFDPTIDLGPTRRIIAQEARHLVKGEAGATEDVGNFRDRTGGTKGQPLARHAGAVGHFVEGRVINRRFRREIENDQRHLGPPYHRQYGGGEGVSRNVEENQIDVGPAKRVSCRHRRFRRIDQAQVNDLKAGPGQFLLHLGEVSAQALFQSRKLRPVGVESYSEKPDLQRVHKIG